MSELSHQEKIVEVLRRYEEVQVGHKLDGIEVCGYALRKLNEEVGELTEYILLDAERFVGVIDIGLELADIYIVLCRIAEYYGVDIQNAAMAKLCVLEQRIQKANEEANDDPTSGGR